FGESSVRAYTLRVEADGYQTSIVSGTLAESDIIIQDIFLCPLTLPKYDLNGDNSVDLKDAIIALKILTGLAEAYCNQADVNGDGKIGVEELTYILQKVAGLR
ncbi:MAG: hypothetical protein HC887_00515, partial [Desulfobacteraceae bacterium]|nr:hypothetical protein [Desulfobacteraceae bacterium]